MARAIDPHDPTASLATEWLLANGRGGFAMGSALGVNTRRYHGLLVAASPTPPRRLLALHSVIEQVEIDDATVDLATHHFGDPPRLHPPGFRHLRSVLVDAERNCVTWGSCIGDVEVSRTLFVHEGVNAVTVEYVVHAPVKPVRLRLRPLTPMRDMHALDDERVTPAPDVAVVHGDPVVRRHGQGLRLACPDATWADEPEWWRGFRYVEDVARGQSWCEDVWSPGTFTVDVPPGARITVRLRAALTDDVGAPAGDTPPPAPLHAAARAFVVERPDDAEPGTTIIAGYPWFADWGRDAMISLPGLLLSTGRHAAARSVLERFRRLIRHGLLPNCTLDDTPEPLYNTVDAGLWFAHAVHRYARVTGDADMNELIGGVRAIVSACRAGTRYGIRVAADGLLAAGDGTEPVTWMDAQRGGVTFTPRDGCAVEVNALWHNALCCLADLVGPGADADDLRGEAERSARAFRAAFWWPERGCLRDVAGEDRVRPNQIFAVSLPFSPLADAEQSAVVDVVRDRLLTPFGLRTLDPDDPGYRGRYEGDLMERDAAYHNGTVWPWLIGPYCDALLRVSGEDAIPEVRAAIEPLLAEMDRGCVGQLAEVYDGDEPHRASGCPAQAWSVAEVLRIADRVGMTAHSPS
jgi:glycogen debranching enzyme